MSLFLPGRDRGVMFYRIDMAKRSVIIVVLVFVAFLAFQYLYSGTLDVETAERTGFDVIAHRGVSQPFRTDNLDNQTCTASRIYKPKNNYIENTIASIQAAFEYGATIVEFDIRPTKDKKFVVFHDEKLDCKTNGKGLVSAYTVAELKQLDVGYGYTFDGGKTYPLRGKGIGKMPTLEEVLRGFPNKKFLIDNKSGNNLEVADMLAKALSRLPISEQKKLFLWSQDAAYDFIHSRLPNITRLLLPFGHQKKFFTTYLLSIGMMRVGDAYKDQGLALPIKYTKYMWGWPNRLLNKIYGAGARFYLVVNNPDDLGSISGIPLNGIITYDIEILGKHIEKENVYEKRN
jgi:glycerophosphoryl diester phosphodiesterase